MSEVDDLVKIWSQISYTKKGYIQKDDLVNDVPSKLLENYIKRPNEKTRFNTNLLPHPFFGDIENSDILILAKNPSYAPVEDEIDTYLYLSKRKIDEFAKDLTKVDFTKKIEFDNVFSKINSNKIDDENINYLFINTWKWWQDNVFRGIEFKDNKKVSIVNLCGYHSKSYSPYKSNLESQNKSKEYLQGIIKSFNNDNKLVIIVWGKEEWNKYLQSDSGDSKKVDSDNNDFFKNFQNIIVLNDKNITNNTQNKSIYRYYISLKSDDDKKEKLKTFFSI